MFNIIQIPHLSYVSGVCLRILAVIVLLHVCLETCCYAQESAGLNSTRGHITAHDRALQKNFSSLVMVTLALKGGTHQICSGTLITPSWVLTAGHCLFSDGKRLPNIQVHAGVVSYQEIVEKNTKNSQTRVVRINATYLHPDYKCCESLVNDFGLLQIKPKFNLTDTVSTTNLAGKPLGSEKDICILAGYGAQKGQMFGKLKIHKISSKRLSTHKECPCKWTKRKIWSVSSPKKTKDYLCRINQEDDQPLGYGDYGAAIMKSKRVYGVFSSILHESFHKSCSLKMFSREEILIHSKTEKLTTAVFSDTCRYVNWINKYTHSLNLEDIDSDCGNRGRLLSPSVLTTVLVFLNILILLMQN
ncbi:coagulation factor XI-like isoform X1 [Homalodisca vitripennis]|uniref:coagulation factor XI-like isoform X1 n=1 Tax=Homalodisca vitripennis TaxID=197043 RepID=UPI001EEB5013|nr:coagulation factor XI-like isoform X1 [Homalodisca vitripennis]